MLDVKSDKFNDDQKAYIRKYAAGLLLVWAGPAVIGHITPDTMDGFEPPAGVFPDFDNLEDDYTLDGANEVQKLLDDWLDEIAKLAGFEGLDAVFNELADDQLKTDTVYMKYPVMK